MSQSALRCKNLRKTYSSWWSENVHALRGIDVDVPKGHIYGLLGPNGAGKTTFVKAMLGLVSINQGEAELLGAPVPDVSIRERVGYLPEDHQLPGHLTGEKAVHFYGKLNGVTSEKRRERTERFLKQVKMWEDRNKKIKTYSKGMKQRVGLAQALVNDPDLLFLDEPTDGVDPVGRKMIRDLLEDLVESGNRTIFINSHILTELELVCDRVAILKNGEMIREGSLDELRGDAVRYRVSYAEHPHNQFLSDVRKRWSIQEEDDGGCTVSLPETSDVDELVELIHDHKLKLREFSGTDESLEDYFIEVVTETT